MYVTLKVTDISYQKCGVCDLSLHCPKPVLLSQRRSLTASFAPGIHPGTWAAFSNTKNLKLLGAYSVILQQKGPSQSHQRLPHGSPGWQQMPWGACREDGQTPHVSALSGREIWKTQALPWKSHDLSLHEGTGDPAGLQTTHQPFSHPGCSLVSVACLDNKPLKEPSFSTLFRVHSPCPSNTR